MANQRPGNQTANRPDLSETELHDMRLDDLRERARDEGVTGASSLKKEEFVEALLRCGGAAAGRPGAAARVSRAGPTSRATRPGSAETGAPTAGGCAPAPAPRSR